MDTSKRSIQISMWILVALFGLRLLIDILIEPVLTPHFVFSLPELWWRMLLLGLLFLVFMILWNAYRVAQRWSWIALLVTVLLLFGGSIAVLARLGDILWLVANIGELVVALIALAIPFQEFFGT